MECDVFQIVLFLEPSQRRILAGWPQRNAFAGIDLDQAMLKE